MGQKPLGKYIECIECGKEVWRKPSKQSKKTFCSHECYAEYKKTLKGERSSNWKGGKVKNGKYFYVYGPNHPNATKLGYVAEHRLVVERSLGRQLERWEDVHHINGDTEDNRIGNLEVITHINHAKISASQKQRNKNGQFKI